MPIYEYQADNPKNGCCYCREKFEELQKISDDTFTNCPDCDAPVHRLISAPSVGASKSGFDDRAKSSGFHKFEKRDKGTYEKQY